MPQAGPSASRGRRTPGAKGWRLAIEADGEQVMSTTGNPRISARQAQRSAAGPGRRPVQLELFGSQPAPAAGEALRPALVPAANTAPRFDLLRRLNRLTGGRLRSL